MNNTTLTLFLLTTLSTFSISNGTPAETTEDAPLFRFQHRFVTDNTPMKSQCGVQSLADYNNDGLLDVTIGNRWTGLLLIKNHGKEWSDPVKVGEIPFTSLGTVPLDIDNDGWTDLVSAGVWYRNNHDDTFDMHNYDSGFEGKLHVHDMAPGDIDGDGKQDIVAASEEFGFFWYNTNPNPEQDWERTVIDPNHVTYAPSVHGGFSPGGIGDLDGDGDNDIFMAVAWFENRDKGSKWIRHPIELPQLFQGELPFGKSTRSIVVDIDSDGDNDVVFSESDKIDAKIGFLENVNGDGTEWKVQLFPQTAPGRRSSFHSLAVADFNMDGHLDVITVDQEGMMEDNLHAPRWYAFTNTGDGWKEFILLDIGLGGHDIMTGDVDGDGDLDVISKVWRPWKSNVINAQSHVDFIENLKIK